MEKASFRSSRSRLLAVVALAALGAIGLPASSQAKSVDRARAEFSLPGNAGSKSTDASRRSVSRPACKSIRGRTSTSRRRACHRKQRRLREAQPHTEAQSEQGGAVAAVATPPPSEPPSTANPPDPTEDTPPKVAPRCDLVEGDCGIYSEEFWRLLAKYEPLELHTGVYPAPPACMEGGGGCITAIAYLYPDGTVGIGHWVVDPCSPKGWRFWEPDPPACP